MIRFTKGNLLEANAEALVNTVNTVGVMGKGIALMFKERFAENYRLYSAACKANEIVTGRMFITEVRELDGPRWIVNFPTKCHWRKPSQIAWITEGLHDLRNFIVANNVSSIAIPPLGAGNGGLPWAAVREQIGLILGDLDADVLVFEPIGQYQNVSKRNGVEKLTPARALIAELVRRYWVLGMECSLLEIQKLAWFLERSVEYFTPNDNPLNFKFDPHIYGPYTHRLVHLLNDLDGSYLHCEKRIGDAGPLDVIWFDEGRKAFVDTYLNSEAKAYLPALEFTAELIDGFESPFGMELLATVDWLLYRDGVTPTVEGVREGLKNWSGGKEAAVRKSGLFDDDSLAVALKKLSVFRAQENAQVH
ncbi:Appr-1-p processing protein [Pseudomonas sp. LB-090624]|uniref:type II toxin-antitoxin system antitoxin DNA ADP-ribosyl glycohydrolase DarG n=1 Tax=Pseudomonas sp. LB-090624 TaxID=2213079 RepID=UPI000DA0F493|nr:macro domain-containing protein [Pseudomonas sp. LB-090624]PYB70134.1 Appr-1-p processing protein [Pseudomonas sp. LB-090624]